MKSLSEETRPTLAALATACFLVTTPGLMCQIPTPTRNVSGLGAQASAQASDQSSGIVTDVLVTFNEPKAEDDDKPARPPGAGAVFITQADSNTGQPIFTGSGILGMSSHHVSSNLSSASLMGMVTIYGPAHGEGQPPQRTVSVNLTWTASDGSENVKGHDSFIQPKYEMNQDLAGTLRRPKVSGTVMVDTTSLLIRQDQTALWDTINSRNTQTGSSKPSDEKASTLQAGASSGYWSGYWTWMTDHWVWTWLWMSNNHAFVVS